jgi:hypothetical protein
MRNQREYLVGVNYFAGWWEELPNKYVIDGRDWRLDYPERIPVLGEYNKQATMDQEIAMASEYGVDFFQMLWYPVECLEPQDPHRRHLNAAIPQFMNSLNCAKMSFFIEYCNHSPFKITDDSRWEEVCHEWCKAMQHPSYLKINNKPVFKVHSLEHFYQQNDNDNAKVENRLSILREIAKESGQEVPLIGAGGFTPGLMVAPYEFISIYMNVPNLPQTQELYPYSEVLKLAEETWINHPTNMNKPYVPYLPSGWDARPWKDPRATFKLPTREQWTDALKKVKEALDQYPQLGFPASAGPQKAFVIYAWNEFAEGGFVAPTKGEGTMKLEAIRQIFGR